MPSATSSLATLGTHLINTGVAIATVVITDYWGYFLVFGVLVSLAVWIKRVVSLGRH